MDNKNEIQKFNSEQSYELTQFENDFQIAQKMVDFVKKSSYAGLFKKVVPDPNNPETNITVVCEEDIISNIFMGKALGLNPMVAISFGRTLDKTSYFKVMKGKELGMSVASSLQNIFAYEDKEGKIIIGTTVHAKSKVLIDAGITYKFVVDFQPKRYYRYTENGKSTNFLGYDYDKEIYGVINKGGKVNATELKEVLENKLIPITAHITYYSEAIFQRKGWEPHVESYSLLDATDAGLYKGINSDGDVVTGKANWNNHPKTILNGRIISIASNKLAADKAQNILSEEELMEIDTIKHIKQSETIDTDHTVVD